MTWCEAARIALRPFSGSTPAWAARPVTVMRRSQYPCGARRCRRSPSRTRGRAQRPTRAASARMSGVETGEPSSSSGFATKTSRPSASGATAPARRRGHGARRGGPPSCRRHRARRSVPVDPERAGGGGARREDGVEMGEQEEPRPGRVPLEVGDHRVAVGPARVHDDEPAEPRGARPPPTGRPRRPPPWCGCRSRSRRGCERDPRNAGSAAIDDLAERPDLGIRHGRRVGGVRVAAGGRSSAHRTSVRCAGLAPTGAASHHAGSGARFAPGLEGGPRVEVVIGVVLIIIAAIEIAAISAIVARTQPDA